MALLSLPATTPSISRRPKSSEFSHVWKGFLALSSVKALGTGISEDSWTNLKICRCNNMSPASPKHGTSTSMSLADKEEEDYTVGDFCPLYSSLSSIRMNSSGRCARWGRLRAASSGQNGTPATSQVKGRFGEVVRVTKETNVHVNINLDGSGISNCDTGIPFLDHMLDQIASHGIFDVHVKARGDIHIDDHHTNEDIALALGTCLLQALGDRKGIYRFGDFTAPLDEALVLVALDLSGRPYLGYDLCIPTQRVGTYDTQLVEHFFQSLVNTSGMTLHIRQLAGKNSHHIIEATFKAFARALRQAIEHDTRRSGSIPSSKGVLSRT